MAFCIKPQHLGEKKHTWNPRLPPSPANQPVAAAGDPGHRNRSEGARWSLYCQASNEGTREKADDELEGCQRERMGGWMGADQGAGGPGEWWGTVPTVATAPGTQTRQNRRREPLASKVTEGGKGGGVKLKWEGGIDGRK